MVSRIKIRVSHKQKEYTSLFWGYIHQCSGNIILGGAWGPNEGQPLHSKCLNPILSLVQVLSILTLVLTFPAHASF